MRAAAIAVLVLLATPAAALAGGFATVGLSSLPDGTAPDEPWVVELTILGHGRSEAPLDGLRPAVEISGPDGERRRFAAAPTDRTGVYRARVVFPAPGIWEYRIDDGFAGAVHTYPPVQIGGRTEGGAAPLPAAGDGDAGGPELPLALLAAGAAGLVAGGLTRVLARPAAGRPRVRVPPAPAVGAVAAALAFGGVMLLSADDDARPPADGVAGVAVGGTGAELFVRMGCGGCHRLAAANSSGQVGPALDDRLESHTAESLRTAILSPPAGRIMPSDFGERMTEAELDALVGFLVAAPRP